MGVNLKFGLRQEDYGSCSLHYITLNCGMKCFDRNSNKLNTNFTKLSQTKFMS